MDAPKKKLKGFEEIRTVLIKQSREVYADISPAIRYYGNAIGGLGIAMYAVICSHTAEEKKCWSRLEELAKECGISKPTAIVYLKKLIQYKIIKVEAQHRDDGGDSTNVYWLTPLAEWVHPDTVFPSVTEDDSPVDSDSDGGLSSLTQGVKLLNRRGKRGQLGGLSSLTQSPSIVSPTIVSPSIEDANASSSDTPSQAAAFADDVALFTNTGKSKTASPKEPKPLLPEDCQAMKIAFYFRERLLALQPGCKTVPPAKWNSAKMQGWANVFDAMLNIDKRDPRRIGQVINYVTEPGCFWNDKVLAADSLRDKFDRLDIAERNDQLKKATPKFQPTGTKSPLAKTRGEDHYANSTNW